MNLIDRTAFELGGDTVLHYDAHFDLIAEATGRPVRWLLPRGTA